MKTQKLLASAALPPMKPLVFLGSSRDDLTAMLGGVRHDIGLELMRVQIARNAPEASRMRIS